MSVDIVVVFNQTSNISFSAAMAHTFKFPFNALVVGNSQAGKSTWLKRFLANIDHMIEGARIIEVVFCSNFNHDYSGAILLRSMHRSNAPIYF
jgi:predicted AAA+ superfamily ATPase